MLVVPNENTILEAFCFNSCEVCEEPAQDILSISEVQGDNDISPFVGQVVEIQGEVTHANDYGCYIQDDNEIRSGIFIYHSEFSDLTIGVGLKVKGLVDEYNGLTEIKDIESSETFESDFMISPMSLPQAAISEDYECMLVYAESVEAVTVNDYNDWYVKFENNAQFLVDNKYTPLDFTAGEIYSLTGVVEYNYEEFKLSPRNTSDIEIVGAGTELVKVTFQVDMQNENVGDNDVFIYGNWDEVQDSPKKMEKTSGAIYTSTFEFSEGTFAQYTYLYGSKDNLGEWITYNREPTSAECFDDDFNLRSFVVPNGETVLDIVCFGECYKCIPNSVDLFGNEIRYYPNPVDHILYISGLEGFDQGEIKIIDGMGRILIIEDFTTASETQLDLESLTPGQYYLLIQSADAQVSTPVLKR